MSAIASRPRPRRPRLSAFGIPATETIVTVVVLTAALSVLNSGLNTAFRMLFAIRADAWAPHWVADTSNRGVPWKAILLSTLAGWAAVITSDVSPDTVFYFIVNSAGAVALFVYAIIAGSQLRMRRKLQREAPERLTLRMWGYPWLSWLTLAATLFVAVSCP